MYQIHFLDLGNISLPNQENSLSVICDTETGFVVSGCRCRPSSEERVGRGDFVSLSNSKRFGQNYVEIGISDHKTSGILLVLH